MGVKAMLQSAAASEMEETVKESRTVTSKKNDKKQISAKQTTKKQEEKKTVAKKEENKVTEVKKIPEEPKKTVTEKNAKKESEVIASAQPRPKKMGRPSYEELGTGEKRRINKSLTFDEDIFNRAYQAGKKRRISVALFIEDALVKYLEELGE